jgi:hypothetical protein
MTSSITLRLQKMMSSPYLLDLELAAHKCITNKTTKQLADENDLHHNTVHNYMVKWRSILGCTSETQLTLEFIRFGIIHLVDGQWKINNDNKQAEYIHHYGKQKNPNKNTDQGFIQKADPRNPTAPRPTGSSRDA